MQYPRDIRGQNLFALDVNLQRILTHIAPEAAARWTGHLSDFGAWVGGEVDTEAEYTDRHGRPALEAFDRDGAGELRRRPADSAAQGSLPRTSRTGRPTGEIMVWSTRRRCGRSRPAIP
jgi:hypothetical protein